MSEEKQLLTDEAVVLHVKNWQSSDKYVLCFTKEHGKIRFIAYGARYMKNVQGRLLQPFARLEVEVQPGQRIDRLRNCSLIKMPEMPDMWQMAYGSVIGELTALFTEDKEPQPELYSVLALSLEALKLRNPRIVMLSFAIKMLYLTGFAPQMNHCVSCGKELSDEEAYFNFLQGGVVCKECKAKYAGDEVLPCSIGTRQLWQWLAQLDYLNPTPLKIHGAELMELEKFLLRYIYFQTDKELNSLNFLAQLQLGKM